MSGTTRREGEQSGNIRVELAETQQVMKATRVTRDRFLRRQLGVGETVLLRFAPKAIAERFVAGLREYHAYEKYAQTKEELERQLAVQEQKQMDEARAERRKLLEQNPEEAISTTMQVNIKPVIEGGTGSVRIGRSRRKERREVARAQNTEARNSQVNLKDDTETEEQFPFKLVRIQKEVVTIGRDRGWNIIVDDPVTEERRLAKDRAKIAEKSQVKAEAFDLMIRYLKLTGGSTHLLQEESTRPSSHQRRSETISIGTTKYKVRVLKPDGIPGNPLKGKELVDLRIKYVFVPELNAVSIVEVFEDRDRYRS